LIVEEPMEMLRLHDASDPAKAVLLRTALQDAGALLDAPFPAEV
jgi:hypothetical protein